MANTIENRIVQMEFENQSFEKNVQTSIKTLDDLKESLNFDGAEKSLQALDSEGRKFSMDGVATAVETISGKFSALAIIGITALQNLTNEAINFGKQLINSLAVQPVTEGLDEYELKLTTIQTIMNATGDTIDVVSGKIAKLDDYADKTIYSTKDMFDNLATFTNAGIGLDVATEAMIGIANATALAGQGTWAATIAYRNFSDGISNGFMTLMDWRSISRVAKIATQEFRQEVMDAAVATGTLTKGLDGVYRVTATGAEVTRNFEDTLKDQWLTADTLTTVLAKYADQQSDVGAKAWAAAQDVKTYTQLMETLKSSVATGWSTTWELVIGDLEEAKELWTGVANAVGGFLGEFTDARNDMLLFWKENGGRTTLLAAFATLFEKITPVVKAVGDAFKNVFPPATGQTLINITSAFYRFVTMLQIGEGPISIIYRIFQGLFSFISLIGQAIGGVVYGFKQFFNAVAPASGGLFDWLANLGDFVTELNKAAKETEFFKNIFDNFAALFLGIADKVSEMSRNFAAGFAEMTGIDFRMPTLESFKEWLDGVFNSGNAVSDTFSNMRDGVASFLGTLDEFINFESIGKFVGGIANGVRTALKWIGDTIHDTLASLGFDNLLEAINAGIFTTILLSIKNFSDKLLDPITSLTKTLGGFEEVSNGVTGILDAVKTSLSAYTTAIKSDTLLKIAAAVGILSVSFLLLSSIDRDKLVNAIMAISVLFLELTFSMRGMIALTKQGLGRGMGSLVIMILGLAIAITILSVAVKNMASLDMDAMAQGILGIAAAAFILVKSAKTLSKDAVKLTGVGIGLIAISTALLILSSAVRKLGELEFNIIVQGLIAIGVLLLELAVFTKIVGGSGKMVSIGTGLVILGAAMHIFASAIEKIGSLSLEQIGKGLLGMAGALLIMVGAIKLLPTVKLIAAAPSIIIFGAALIILGAAISKLGQLTWNEVAKGLVALAGGLGIILLSLSLLSAGMLLKLIAAAPSLVILSVAITILGNALIDLSSMGWEEIGRGLVALAGALGIIVIAMQFMTSALVGAAAVLIIAAALSILAPILIVLGAMPLQVIGIGLLALAGIFAIFGLAGYLLSPVAPIILMLTAAFLVFSGGIALVAVAISSLLVSLGAFLTILATSGTAIASSIEAISKTMSTLAISIATGLVEALKAFSVAIIESGPIIRQGLVSLIELILGSLIDSIPIIINGLFTLLMAILNSLNEFIGPIITVVVSIIVELLIALGEALPLLIDAAFQLMVGFINGLADGIRDNTDTIMAAVSNLMSSIIEFILAALATLVQHIPVVGEEMAAGLESAREGVREALAPMSDITADEMQETVDAIKDSESDLNDAGKSSGESGIAGMISGLSPSFDVGNTSGTNLKDGLYSTEGAVVSAGKALAVGAVTPIENTESKYGELGSIFGEDFSFELGATAGEAESSGETITTAAETGLMSNEQFYSDTGIQYGEDFAGGLEGTLESAKSAGVEVGHAAEVGILENEYIFDQTGQKYGSAFGTALSREAPYAASSGAHVSNSAASSAGANYGAFYAAGSDGGDGFVNGLSSKIGASSSAGYALGRAAYNAANAALRNGSPSKEMKEVGEYGGQGFINGLISSIRGVEIASEKMGDAALDTMIESLSQIADTVDDTADIEPVIRPVLDMDNLKKDIQQMNRQFGDGTMIMTMGADAVNRLAEQINISKALSELAKKSNNTSSNSNISFTQYNTSPKALSNLEIYRQTNNQLAMVRRLIRT